MVIIALNLYLLRGGSKKEKTLAIALAKMVKGTFESLMSPESFMFITSKLISIKSNLLK